MTILSYSHAVTIDATVEPVSVDEAKRNCDVDDNWRDDDFARWIKEARHQFEHDSRRALMTQTHVLKLDAFPDADYIDLLQPPLISVTSVQYVDTGGSTQTFASSKYSVDTARTPGAILLGYGEIWPATREQRNAVTVTYSAGYGAAAANVPPSAKTAILLLVKHRFEHPELVDSAAWVELPQAYRSIVSQFSWGDYP